ncbi:DUF6124 family protein [Pseudomonas sp. R5(2019)]|uniref:DUF6124 family protein n=1 Tax=Pseudomonas sp. R5(2019) TaxID=2697566 RepID=UPI0014129F7C|nr:DUF3077 domain-containing protein [Pseudomonas sp. R5(2019)]NBA96128.1 DUF3077 domain-containing protein [Pseudomonas sp. R5(2019)]
MKKIVPDPPAFELLGTRTASTDFGATDVNCKPFFNVNAGICGEDALIHATLLLDCAEAAGWDAVDHLTKNNRKMVLGMIQKVEMGRALINALLKGVEVARVSKAEPKASPV